MWALWRGLNAEREFRVWITILGRMSLSLFFRSIIYLFDVRPPLSLDTKIKAFCFTLTTETYLTIVVKATYSVKFEVVHSLEKATDTKYQGFFFFFLFIVLCSLCNSRLQVNKKSII